MPYRPVMNAPIRVPEDLRPDLRFGWPGAPDPSGFLGIGGTGSVGAPNLYDFSSSNAPVGQGAFTIAATVTFSANAEATDRFFCLVGSNATTAPGFLCRVNSGLIRYLEVSVGGAAASVSASRSTLLGDVHRLVFIRDGRAPSLALFDNGVLVSSVNATCSWTSQQTLSIGRHATGVFSHGIQDVYIFNRALTAIEVGLLDRYATGR